MFVETGETFERSVVSREVASTGSIGVKERMGALSLSLSVSGWGGQRWPSAQV